MKTKIVVRKGGGGGDFEIQVFSTASNLPNDLGTEPRLRTLDRHEKRTNLSLKLVKKTRKVLCAERRNAWFSILWHTVQTPLRRVDVPTAYQHVRRASTRLYVCRISRGQQCGATCEDGWGARKSRTSEKCDVENREKLWLDGGEQVEEWNLGQMLKLPLSSQSCKSCTACALPCSARSSLSNPHSAPCRRKRTT
jgi:hypothetical protein